MAYYIPPPEKVGVTSPVSPTKLHQWSCIFITKYTSLLTRNYDHAGYTEYCKDFAVALKMIDGSDKKQMYDSVITR